MIGGTAVRSHAAGANARHMNIQRPGSCLHVMQRLTSVRRSQNDDYIS